MLDFHFRAAVILHIVTWVAQFIGHGFFESIFLRKVSSNLIERKPALLDNILLTLVAPDFVILEVKKDVN